MPHTNETRWTAIDHLLQTYLGKPAVPARDGRPAKEGKAGWRQFLHRGDAEIGDLVLTGPEDLRLEALKNKLDRIMPFTKYMQKRNPSTIALDYADDSIKEVLLEFPEMTKLRPDVPFRRPTNRHFWDGMTCPLINLQPGLALI